MFDMTESNNLVTASGDNYAIIWGKTSDYSETAYSIFTRIFDASNWLDEIALSGSSVTSDFQIAGDGDGFLAAWLQNNGNGENTINVRRFTGTEWSSNEVVDDNGLGKYDLSLLGNSNGYQAIWNSAALDGDPWVRIPWAKSEF
ncbi:MAG: hypothetical protein ABW068_04325 [Candidatus Thiodiazotropha sp.]